MADSKLQLPTVTARILECQLNPYDRTKFRIRVIFPQDQTTFTIDTDAAFASLFRSGDDIELIIKPK